MKNAIIGMAGALIAVSSVHAELFDGEFLAKDQKSIRAEAVFQRDVGPDDEAIGFEFGAGTALYALDDVAVFYTGLENDDFEMQRVGLSAQEHYPLKALGYRLIPFLGVAGGWGWLDDANGLFGPEGEVDNALFGRIELGAVFRAHERLGLAATFRHNWAAEDIFVDDNSLQDSAWDVAVGIRLYY